MPKKKATKKSTAKYRAVKGISYPDSKCLEGVRKAGGRAKFVEGGGELTLKEVAPGHLCSGLPEESVDWLLGKGLIKPVDGE